MCIFSWIFKKTKDTPTISVEQFVSESLVQICNGIRSAQTKITRIPFGTDEDKYFVPYIMPYPAGGRKDEISQIHFDIAVTVSHARSTSHVETTSIKGAITTPNIFVVEGRANLEKGKTTDQSASSISRITFSIPVIYPRMPLPLSGSEK